MLIFYYFSWTLNLEASGSINMLSAFRAAVENDDDVKKYGGVEGVYILTSGIPDQEEVNGYFCLVRSQFHKLKALKDIHCI